VGLGDVYKRQVMNTLENFPSLGKAIVLHPGSPVLRLVPHHYRVIMNGDPDSGLSGSIRSAVSDLRNSADAIMFVLADQPLISSKSIGSLLDLHSRHPKKIISYAVRGDPRNPMIFPSNYFDDLLSLKGDNGARKVAIENDADLVRLEVEGVELLDVDLPVDRNEIEKILRSRGRC